MCIRDRPTRSRSQAPAARRARRARPRPRGRWPAPTAECTPARGGTACSRRTPHAGDRRGTFGPLPPPAPDGSPAS
eukprot:13306507-Alexandrium_andersonii.AAC.1